MDFKGVGDVPGYPKKCERAGATPVSRCFYRSHDSSIVLVAPALS